MIAAVLGCSKCTALLQQYRLLCDSRSMCFHLYTCATDGLLYKVRPLPMSKSSDRSEGQPSRLYLVLCAMLVNLALCRVIEQPVQTNTKNTQNTQNTVVLHFLPRRRFELFCCWPIRTKSTPFAFIAQCLPRLHVYVTAVAVQYRLPPLTACQ